MLNLNWFDIISSFSDYFHRMVNGVIVEFYLCALKYNINTISELVCPR